MRISIIFILLIKTILCSSQGCENYNRKLFNDLPESPEVINCKDALGQKQGWWIYYTKRYNSVDLPDELETGEYVPSYSYGQYANNRKIGVWRTINNVHLIYERNVESFYYSQDTVLVTSWHNNHFFEKISIYYNADSSIINSSSITESRDRSDTVFIRCNKNVKPSDKNCEMTYRGNQIKTFPISNFEFELDVSFYNYYREKKIIDYNYR